MIRLIIDCFGGDLSPQANVEAAVMALKDEKTFPDLSLILTGDAEKIQAELDRLSFKSDRLTIEHAPEVIDCNDKPTDAIRLKRESSMMKAIRMLREDDTIGGMVSTGSTGALVAAATLRVGRLKGVIRPAFCPVLPTMNGGIVAISDSGANVECNPEMLRQFAVMAARYLEAVYGVKEPRVALLNVGVEEEKGDDLRKQTYALLKETPGLNFVGNMESRDLLSGKFDLVVCDGFAGNVLIKSTEGACLQMLKKLKTDISSSLLYKLGALLMLPMFKKEKEFMNYQNYGGSVLLGAKKVIVKGHGSATATSVLKCIEQAYRMEMNNLNLKTEEELCALLAEKSEQKTEVDN